MTSVDIPSVYTMTQNTMATAVFENEDILGLITEKVKNVKTLESLFKTCKTIKKTKKITKRMDNLYSLAATRIQQTYREYLDKEDFITDFTNLSNRNANTTEILKFLDDELPCIRPRYLRVEGEIGKILVDVYAVYMEINQTWHTPESMWYNMVATTGQLNTFARLLHEYLW